MVVIPSWRSQLGRPDRTDDRVVRSSKTHEFSSFSQLATHTASVFELRVHATCRTRSRTFCSPFYTLLSHNPIIYLLHNVFVSPIGSAQLLRYTTHPDSFHMSPELSICAHTCTCSNHRTVSAPVTHRLFPPYLTNPNRGSLHTTSHKAQEPLFQSTAKVPHQHLVSSKVYT